MEENQQGGGLYDYLPAQLFHEFAEIVGEYYLQRIVVEKDFTTDVSPEVFTDKGISAKRLEAFMNLSKMAEYDIGEAWKKIEDFLRNSEEFKEKFMQGSDDEKFLEFFQRMKAVMRADVEQNYAALDPNQRER